MLACFALSCALLADPGLADPGLASSDVATAPPIATGWIPTGVEALQSARSGGVAQVDRALERLGGHRRVLMLAAHPDDEDTFVLALAARGLGAEAAYLSLSRGDGGQNLIGSESGEGLGLLRTGELQSARTIDGARQFFSRAYDFGYTRSLPETLERWPEEILLEDTMRVVRRFRPQVLISVFPSDARAGHGQHQAAGHVAERVFELSRGPDRFPELTAEGLAPWPVQAFFRASWWNPEGADLHLPLGELDAHSGRSIFQVALESRSRHRCQDMGFEQPPGDAKTALIRVYPEAIEGEEEGLFAGIDTSLSALADPLADPELGPRLALALERLEGVARAARARLGVAQPSEAVGPLAELVRELSALHAETSASAPAEGRSHVVALLEEKLVIAREGLAAAAGIVADAVSDQETVVPGGTLEARTLLWDAEYGSLRTSSASLAEPASGVSGASGVRHGSAGGNSSNHAVEDARVDLWVLGPKGPAGQATELAAEPEVETDRRRSRFSARVDDERRFEVEISPRADASAPYYLHRARSAAGDLYDWQGVGRDVRGLPDSPGPIWARFRFRLAGAPMELWREVVHRRRDQVLGEVRRPVRILPALEVKLDRPLAVSRIDTAEPVELRVRVRSHVGSTSASLPGEVAGAETETSSGIRLDVRAPEGWTVVESGNLELGPDGEGQVGLRLLPPTGASTEPTIDTVRVAAVWNGRRYEQWFEPVDYPHIRPALWPKPASVRLVRASIELPRVKRIGYVRGAADPVPELLGELGLPIEILAPEALSSTDLRPFEVIVIGSRAYEVTPELGRANGRLLDYVRAGGRLVVQYQQYGFARGRYVPFPLDIARPHDRVTDETAPVRVLDPGHALVRRPNALREEDWRGWVQERGLYFAGTWDDAWTPVLAMADPASDGPWVGGERGPEKLGGLLVSHPGEGVYIYTGLAFFRQLPAGVPGAYRLLANLLAYEGPSDSREVGSAEGR